jgi:putative two-component system response regulator
LVSVYLIVQILGIIGISASLIYLNTQAASKGKDIIMLGMVALLIYTIGCTAEFCTKSEEAARNCLYFSFLGKSYIGWLLFTFYTKLYKVKMPQWIIWSLGFIHTVFYCSVMLSEYTQLFFISCTYHYKGFSYFNIVPGVFCYFHYVIAFGYILLILYWSIQKMLSKPAKNDMRIYTLTAVFVLFPLIGIILQYANVLFPYNIMELSLLFSAVLINYVVIKFHIFDLIDYGKSTAIETISDAVIMFNSDYKIVYFNPSAQKIFPDIVSMDKTYKKYVIKMMSLCYSIIQINCNYYEVKLSVISVKNRANGYVMLLSDVTEHIVNSEHLEEMVKAKTKQLTDMQEHLMVSFANMIEKRDGVTGEHVQRTREYVKSIAAHLCKQGIVDNEYVDKLYKAAPLHDIGKVAVPDSILNKPGKLTPEEFEVIKTHTTLGGEILSEVQEHGRGEDPDDYIKFAYNMARYHHEKWNGTGYPEKLAGEKIPLCARIMAVADVFDALISKRCYKEAMPYDEAFKIMKEESGTHFQPELIDIFLNMQPEIIQIAESYK